MAACRTVSPRSALYITAGKTRMIGHNPCFWGWGMGCLRHIYKLQQYKTGYYTWERHRKESIHSKERESHIQRKVGVETNTCWLWLWLGICLGVERMEFKRLPWGISADRLKQQANGHALQALLTRNGFLVRTGLSCREDSLPLPWMVMEGDSLAAKRPLSYSTS